MILSRLQKLRQTRALVVEFKGLLDRMIEQEESERNSTNQTRLAGETRRRGLDLSRMLTKLRNPNATDA